MAGVGQIISNEDYNNIRSKVSVIMGTGVSTSGYGQNVFSTDVASNQQITKAQWDSLRFDLVNAIIHQTGSQPAITIVSTTDPIRYGASQPNFQYNTLADQAVTNKFLIGEGQYIVSSKATTSRTTAWTSSLLCDLTVTFGTVDQARFFFNSGGKVRFTSSRSGGASTAQNNAWSGLLDSAGNFDFGGNTPEINFYSLTNIFQTVYQLSSSSPYSANTYRVLARCNVSDNSAGTANTVFFRVTWTDPYVDPSPGNPPAPGDSVDGTLTLSVSELKAQGDLVPSGTFSISSPTYSLSAISGS